MTSIRAAVVGAVGCIVLAGGVPAAAQGRTGTPEELYQQALTRERAAGDIRGAIQLYREVAASTDRVFAARALLRLGQAYEKLGASESQAAYERIVREFADQSEPVSVARTRLAALRAGRPPAQSAVAPALSMILAELPALRPRDAAQFDFSPSGDEVVFRRSMADSDPLAGSALEIAASGGAIVRTLLPADRQMGRVNPRWSPDGRYIAYLQRSFVGADTSFVGLMVVPSGGGTPRVVSTDVGMARPAQGGLLWTPDSRGIAVWSGNGLTTFDLDGRTVGSVALRLRHQGQVTSYSPDGRWLAYHVINEGSEQHDEVDVWIVSAQGGEPVQLTKAPGYDGWPVWAADGQSVFFVSDRSGNRNVWKIDVDPRSGTPRGEPVQVTSYADATLMYPRVIDGGKRLAFALVRQMGAIHVASTSTPSDSRPVTRGSKATLSPDGRTIYYVAQGTNPPGIFAVSVDGGAPRRLTSTAPSGPYVPYALSRDGRHIAYFTRADARNILSTISTAGESPTEVVRLDSREELVPSWSPDGSRLAYAHGTGLFVISASGGAPVRVAQLAGWDGWSVRWSPDGQYLAAFGWPDPPASGEQNSVYVVPAQGGELQRLTTAAEPGYKEGLEWHPDGRRLSYMYYGHDGRGDETRIAYLDGSPTTHLLDQPYPIWDYLGVWDPSGRTYYFNASTRGTWGLYALGESGGAARTVWLESGVSPGASLPSFSRDGRTMVWTVEQTTRQLWSVDTSR